ncbi:MAG: RDD family protein [Actinomycetota bacterium]|nr:RDD family protein [Actinomycetota bacterium]
MTPPPPPPPPPSSPPGGYPPGPPGGYPPGPPGGGSAAGAGSPWGTLAEWSPRALGLLIDVGVGVGGFLVIFIVGLILGAISSALMLIVDLIAYLGLIGWQVWIATQVGATGTSPGMRVVGLKCLGQETGQTIGAGLGVVRWLAHFVDGVICYIGWLFPLWDPQKQTLADKIMRTVVITAPKQPFSITPPATTTSY